MVAGEVDILAVDRLVLWIDLVPFDVVTVFCLAAAVWVVAGFIVVWVVVDFIVVLVVADFIVVLVVAGFIVVLVVVGFIVVWVMEDFIEVWAVVDFIVVLVFEGFIVLWVVVSFIVVPFLGINSGSVVTLPLVMITTFSVAGLSVVVCTGTFGVLFVVVGFSDDNSSVTKFDAVVVSDDVPVDDVTVDLGEIDSGFRYFLSDSPQYKLIRSSDFV